MKQFVRIKLIEKAENKLQLVKLIKDCSELGLKESKDICDKLHNGEVQIFETRQDDNINYAKKFRQDISICGGRFQISGGVEEQRDFKILELGLGSDEDYVDFLIKYFDGNFENRYELFKFVLSKLDKEDLNSAFDITKETYKKFID
jgi:hypothetical protein